MKYWSNKPFFSKFNQAIYAYTNTEAEWLPHNFTFFMKEGKYA